MTDARNPADRALDLLVFAPLGLALEARELLPHLTERGRSQLESQVGMAKVVGQFAVQMGRAEIDKRLARFRGESEVAVTAAPPVSAATAPLAPHPPDDAPGPPASRPNGRAAVAVGSLAIPDYDSLAASQVVPRLAGLSTTELDAVRRYEEAHRGRKTILARIVQLHAS
ncbi:MAG: hypothetical protein IPM45_01385 [Acidimicrobiales bacterium]|nr:hypothetical protein [Acidimicrobiales bacterium]